MSDILRDLYGHQAWADAEHWRAFEDLSAGLSDSAVRARLHHIHLVQRRFLAIVRGDQEYPPITRADDYPDMRVLKHEVRAYHDEVIAFLQSTDPATLAEPVVMPWPVDPPFRITGEQALLQCAMHSQYHRGQNATRLRELGGEPPTTDLIMWYWKQRPQPRWE